LSLPKIVVTSIGAGRSGRKSRINCWLSPLSLGVTDCGGSRAPVTGSALAAAAVSGETGGTAETVA
jgi:hypothetical protein